MKKVFSIFMLLLLLASGVAFASAHGESSEVISKKTSVFDSGFRNNMMSSSFATNHMNDFSMNEMHNDMWSYNLNVKSLLANLSTPMKEYRPSGAHALSSTPFKARIQNQVLMRSSHMNYWSMNTIHKEEIKEELNHGRFSWFW